ncbi:hypothetical protein B0T18DRAFT_413738 [Schizothecium vesticola]|uniref:Uncharacterized protein n=1 Tax=Schizothecium vesticola TaxID=314040 RepID=A0AA40ENX4_9PEZI|nr:hypothetical protein B0T18DRAFT_413738 [Schizothecium vesticola]
MEDELPFQNLLFLFILKKYSTELIRGIPSLVVAAMFLVNVFGPLYWQSRWFFFFTGLVFLGIIYLEDPSTYLVGLA